MVKNALMAGNDGLWRTFAGAASFPKCGEGLVVDNPLRFDLHQSRRLSADRGPPVARAGAGIVHRGRARVAGDNETAANGGAVFNLEECGGIADAQAAVPCCARIAA